MRKNTPFHDPLHSNAIHYISPPAALEVTELKEEKHDLLTSMLNVPLCPISDEVPTDEQRKFSKTWAILIKKIWGADPLECPKCKSRMKVIDFITDDFFIEKSLKDLGIKSLNIDTAERGPPLSMAGLEDLFL